jgi:hypothetical protein
MKTIEMREELESYGISAKSFLEKHEIVAALEEARRKERRPLKSFLEKKKKPTISRDQEIERQIRRIQSKSLKSLKSEIKKQGISRAPLHLLTHKGELSMDYITTYATAIVDGKFTKHKLPRNQDGLPLDPSYYTLFVRLWMERENFSPDILLDASDWIERHPEGKRVEFLMYIEAKHGETRALKRLRAKVQDKNQIDPYFLNHIYRQPELLHPPIRIKTNIKFMPTV